MNTLETRRRLLGRNVYRRTTEGNPAIAQGSLARMYPGITMQGRTEQPQYEGNQLFDASKYFITEYSAGGAKITNNGDGSFTINGEGALTSDFLRKVTISGDEARTFLKSGIIRSNQHSTVPKFYCYAEDAEGSMLFTTGSTGSANVTEEMLEQIASFIYVFFSKSAPIITPGVIWPMIYQDGDGTYEPYTGGQPSPSPDYPQPITSAGKYNEATGKWDYKVKLTGANLFDISKVITNSGLLTNNGDGTLTATPGSGDSAVCGKVPRTLRDYCPELISGKTYRLSANTTGTVKQIYLRGVNNVWIYGRSRTITDADLESEIWFYASGVNTEAVISDIMITEVENADYEPYRTPQTVTLTSDRQLTKWDKLEKRNGQWGWVYKSDVLEYNGDERWIYDANNTRGEYSALYHYDTRVLNKDYSYCDKFGHIVQLHDREGIMDSYGDPSSFYISIKSNRLASTDADGFKQWLSENPLTVLYETAAETFAPLTESEQEAMNALYTFRPTTVLSNDCDCNMSLTYKTKKSLEVTT